MSKKFALIGAGGYIAPRHMKAVKDNNADLVVAYDPNDSVGVIDSYSPESEFFTDFEQFENFISSQSDDKAIEFLAICSPNYLHEPHVSYGLRKNMQVICEKPLVLDVESLNRLEEIEQNSQGAVNCILQLRLHQEIKDIKAKIEQETSSVKKEVELTYITSRGKWYLKSWKGDENKSGGLALNIGIHFFDMLGFLFGELQTQKVFHRSEKIVSGLLEFERANVKWFLSVDDQFLPVDVVKKSQRTYRRIAIDDYSVEFSGGFTELHTDSYKQILAGEGFGLKDVRPSIELVEQIRTLPIEEAVDADLLHPFLRNK